MEVKVFGKAGCEYCKTTMKKFETFFSRWNLPKEKIALTFYDMDTLDGLTEGAFHSVVKVPTTVIEKDKNLLARWDGKVPLSQEFKGFFEEFGVKDEKELN